MRARNHGAKLHLFFDTTKFLRIFLHFFLPDTPPHNHLKCLKTQINGIYGAFIIPFTQPRIRTRDPPFIDSTSTRYLLKKINEKSNKNQHTRSTQTRKEIDKSILVIKYYTFCLHISKKITTFARLICTLTKPSLKQKF
jgi:hypothetical protein